MGKGRALSPAEKVIRQRVLWRCCDGTIQRVTASPPWSPHLSVRAPHTADGTPFCSRRWSADARRGQRGMRRAQSRASAARGPGRRSRAAPEAPERRRRRGPSPPAPSPRRRDDGRGPRPSGLGPRRRRATSSGRFRALAPSGGPTALPPTGATLIDVNARRARRSLTSHSVIDYAPARKRSGASPSPCGGRANDDRSRPARGSADLAAGLSVPSGRGVARHPSRLPYVNEIRRDHPRGRRVAERLG